MQDSIPKRLRKHFSFVPRLRYDQMPTLYKLAAESGGCLVIPSRNESQPMSILEAMFSECPVVAASVGGMREMVVDGVTGFLFGQGETEAAIGAVCRLLQDKHERSQISSRALLLTKLDHSSSRAADLYMALIDKVTSQSSQIPMDAAGDRAESVELLASSVARGKLAARLDSLIGEFVSLHMDILKVRPDASLSESIIRSLLSGISPSTEHSDQSVLGHHSRSAGRLRANRECVFRGVSEAGLFKKSGWLPEYAQPSLLRPQSLVHP